MTTPARTADPGFESGTFDDGTFDDGQPHHASRVSPGAAGPGHTAQAGFMTTVSDPARPAHHAGPWRQRRRSRTRPGPDRP
ncbi:hypothetical protein [Streptomyces sp. NK08204]|uniref:hypothetical protein n=1 Tax=Streptomyces sp. NK08204 TaxID=2873260 RepID=UPI001CED6FE1|nr:hypothetical protein [Streptomyces sp. NK08204]